MFYPLIIVTNFGLFYLGHVDGVQYDVTEIFQIVKNYLDSSRYWYANTTFGIPSDTIFWKRYLYFLYMPLTTTQITSVTNYFVLENIFLLFVTIIIIKEFKFNLKGIDKLTLSYYLSILVFFLFMPLIFSNYGVALRYKWFVIPYFLLAFLDLRKKIK